MNSSILGFIPSNLDSDFIDLHRCHLITGCKCVMSVYISGTLLYSSYFQDTPPPSHPCFSHVCAYIYIAMTTGAGSGSLLCDRWISHLVLSMYMFSSWLALFLSNPCRLYPNCSSCYFSVHNLNNSCICVIRLCVDRCYMPYFFKDMSNLLYLSFLICNMLHV